MAEESSALKPAAAPAAFTPWTWRDTKLRATMLEALRNLKPAGNPEPRHLELVKALATDQVEMLPPEANAAEVLIEANYTGAAIQTHVIVWPKSF